MWAVPVLARDPRGVFDPTFSSLLLVSPQRSASLHRMCTERTRFRVAAQAVSGAELNQHNYENSSRSLPAVLGLRMEAGSGSAGTRRHALRLPVAGAWRRHDYGGTNSEEI